MELAPSIRRIGDGTVGVCLVEEAGAVTTIDAGLPGYRGLLPAERRRRGGGPARRAAREVRDDLTASRSRAAGAACTARATDAR
jgi:hypothetical protein